MHCGNDGFLYYWGSAQNEAGLEGESQESPLINIRGFAALGNLRLLRFRCFSDSHVVTVPDFSVGFSVCYFTTET